MTSTIERRKESVVVSSKRYQVVVPAYPQPCSYVRIRFWNGVKWQQLVRWDKEKWQEDDAQCSCFGAIIGAVSGVIAGEDLHRAAFQVAEDEEAV